MTLTRCCLTNSLATRHCWHSRLLLQHCSFHHTFRATCSKLRNRPDFRCASTYARPPSQKPTTVHEMSRNVNNGSAYLQASHCYYSCRHLSTTMSRVSAEIRFWVADWTLPNLHHLCYSSLIIKGSPLVLEVDLSQLYPPRDMLCHFPGIFSMLERAFSDTVSSTSSS